MEHDANAYCWDFNESGYCKTCGKRRKLDSIDGPEVKQWPTTTWFQERRAKVLRDEAEKLDKTDWR